MTRAVPPKQCRPVPPPRTCLAKISSDDAAATSGVGGDAEARLVRIPDEARHPGSNSKWYTKKAGATERMDEPRAHKKKLYPRPQFGEPISSPRFL